MVGVFLTYVLHTEVIHDEGETDGPRSVAPKTWGRVALAVAMCFKTFLKKLLRYQACVWETVYSVANFYEYVTFLSTFSLNL